MQHFLPIFLQRLPEADTTTPGAGCAPVPTLAQSPEQSERCGPPPREGLPAPSWCARTGTPSPAD
eukprot:1153961-Pelagomonas_calceolata.AAC.6